MEYIANFSGGKDSTATIILAHEHGEPLDEVVFSEVMYSESVSGEMPEHIDFVKNVAFPLFESWGYKTRILRAEKNYLDCFYHILKRSRYPERIGKKAGFPMAGKCAINRDCKVKPIEDYLRTKDKGEVTQYIGIAADEPKRLARLDTGKKVSLLAKYNYTEEMAKAKAKQYGLLSPCYKYSTRGGCWFCPNSGMRELRHLRSDYEELWNELLRLEEVPDIVGSVWNSRNRVSIHEIEEQFYWEDAQMEIFDFI